MEDKILIDLGHINQLKSFYGKTTEEMILLLDEYKDQLNCKCPDYCELKEFFENILQN